MSAANEQSVCSHAKRYLRNTCGWVTNKELAAHLGVPINRMSPSMGPAVKDGSVERMTRPSDKLLVWRLTPRPVKSAFLIDWPPRFVSQFDSVRLP